MSITFVVFGEVCGNIPKIVLAAGRVTQPAKAGDHQKENKNKMATTLDRLAEEARAADEAAKKANRIFQEAKNAANKAETLKNRKKALEVTEAEIDAKAEIAKIYARLEVLQASVYPMPVKKTVKKPVKNPTVKKLDVKKPAVKPVKKENWLTKKNKGLFDLS